MKLTDALDYANSFYIPELIFSGGYDSIESERQRGEDALKALVDEWNANENPSFGFDLIRELADRNRGICDHIGEARRRNRTARRACPWQTFTTSPGTWWRARRPSARIRPCRSGCSP